MNRSRASVALAIGISAMATGCIAEPAPPSERPILTAASPSASTAASSPGTRVSPEAGSGQIGAAEPTPEPTIPARLPPAAVHEDNGVRITIELERNPMPAGQPTWVDTTVTNTGRDVVVHYPCGEAVTVDGRIAGEPWRPGRQLPEPELSWKAYLLESMRGEARDQDREIRFLRAGDQGSASGCGDIAHTATLAPGASLHERLAWDGLTFRGLAPPPTAKIDLVGSFPFDRGDPLVEHPPENRTFFEVHLETWIAGLLDAFLDPGEAADIALTDPRLSAVLASHDLRNGNGGLVRYDPATGAYQVGLIEENLPVARAHVVLVDARSGRIIGFVERDWNMQVDGYP
ncbi:MAG TPA: hypothetical protein VGJ71_04380 [Candidatus Limnocylindrales bacterium]|jgi:hypothetical protein